MRLIKYRGKSLHSGEYVYGFYWALLDPSSPETDYKAHYLHNGVNISEAVKIDPDTLGQFTGLYDKEGNEVYEGMVMSKDPYLKVVYEDGGFCFANDLYTGSDRITQERVKRLTIIEP